MNSRDGLGQLPPAPSSGMAVSCWSKAMEMLLRSRLSWEEVEMLRGIRLSREEVEAEVCPEKPPPKEQCVLTEGEQGTPMWGPRGRELRVRVTRRRRMRVAAGTDAGSGSAKATTRPSSGGGSARLGEPAGFGGGGSVKRDMRSFGRDTSASHSGAGAGTKLPSRGGGTRPGPQAGLPAGCCASPDGPKHSGGGGTKLPSCRLAEAVNMLPLLPPQLRV